MPEITAEQATKALLELDPGFTMSPNATVLHDFIQQQRTRPPHGEVRWLVYSREHNLWWRSNGAGYAPVIEEAGRYTREEAEQICATAGTGRGRHRDDGDDGPPEFCVPDPLCIVEPSPGVTVAREVLEKVSEAFTRLHHWSTQYLMAVERQFGEQPKFGEGIVGSLHRSIGDAAEALALLKDSPHA